MSNTRHFHSNGSPNLLLESQMHLGQIIGLVEFQNRSINE